MTIEREEAIKYLIRPVVSSTTIGKIKQKELDAYNMAIEALQTEVPPYCVLGSRPLWSEPKTWHEKNGHTYICGDCGFEQAIYGNINEYNCCPRCGVYKEYVDYGGIFPQKRTPYREDGEV